MTLPDVAIQKNGYYTAMGDYN